MRIIIWLMVLLLLAQVGFSQEVYVQVRVENVIDLIGMSIYIGYDPITIEVYDMNSDLEGTQIDIQELGLLSNPVLLAGLKKDVNANEQPGTLIIGYSSVPSLPISGDGDCFKITFNKLTTGDNNIHFILDKSSIQNESGIIEAEWFVDDVDRTNDVARVILEITDPSDIDPEVKPHTYNLAQNYPNPFNPSTTIEFSIGSYNNVSLVLFDVLGRKIKTLIDGEILQGNYRIMLNGENMSTGNYYYHLNVGNNKFNQSRKMTILK